jgi:polyisoprenyl-phosphate glycosyltransferase
MKKTIGIMCATFNEEENVELLVKAIDSSLAELSDEISYKILFIDNDSEDGTQNILREIAKSHNHVSCIFNERNYGANRSAFHGMLQCPGDAVIMMCADFQDPPEVLPKIIRKWLAGDRVVMCRKASSSDGFGYKLLRASYYRVLAFSHPMYRDIIGCTGFGIYDRSIIDRLQTVKDSTPFFRGLVAEVCSSITHFDYDRPQRLEGSSSTNLYRLWDEGVIGLMNNSKIAIRVISIFGIFCALLSVIIGFLVIFLKIMYWDLFPIGIIPLFLLQLFSIGCIMLCLGAVGEYIGAIYTQSIGRQRVFEKERIE